MLYGLTPAESRVAMLLACGKSVREIGDACQYTVQTVQWYSKQILSKTGCRSRAALVRELSGPLISLTIASPE
jgi:DNA-binding NarL/FixJ family response regulator